MRRNQQEYNKILMNCQIIDILNFFGYKLFIIFKDYFLINSNF
jgi:hypothetical protein